MRTRRERHALRSGTGARAALVIEYDPKDDGRAWFSGSWDETGLPITGFSRTVLLERWSDGGWRAASIREGSRTPLDAALAWLAAQGEDFSVTRGNPSGRRTSFRSRADALRYEAAERAAAISVLGMEPEIPGDRYAATLGELVRWVREAGLEDQMNEEARRIYEGASPQRSRRRRLRNDRLTAAERHGLPDRYFAVPENEGLPIDTKGRLRAAMARFDQYGFDSKAQVDRAFRNILRRAKQLKVDASRFENEFESGDIVAKIAR